MRDFCSLVEEGKIDEVRVLLETHPELIHELSAPDTLDQPLHLAAWQNHGEIASLLLDKGADINAVGDRGWTPLHYAAYHGSLETAQILITGGANLNAGDDSGYTPVFYAARGREPECLELGLLLERAGARVDLNTIVSLGHLHQVCDYLHHNSNALMETAAPSDVIDDLVIAAELRIGGYHPGESGDSQDVINEFAQALNCLIVAGCDVNEVGSLGVPPLFNAVQSGSAEIVRLLLEKGADPNAKFSNMDAYRDERSWNMNNEERQIKELLLKYGYKE